MNQCVEGVLRSCPQYFRGQKAHAVIGWVNSIAGRTIFSPGRSILSDVSECPFQIIIWEISLNWSFGVVCRQRSPCGNKPTLQRSPPVILTILGAENQYFSAERTPPLYQVPWQWILYLVGASRRAQWYVLAHSNRISKSLNCEVSEWIYPAEARVIHSSFPSSSLQNHLHVLFFARAKTVRHKNVPS